MNTEAMSAGGKKGGKSGWTPERIAAQRLRMAAVRAKRYPNSVEQKPVSPDSTMSLPAPVLTVSLPPVLTVINGTAGHIEDTDSHGALVIDAEPPEAATQAQQPAAAELVPELAEAKEKRGRVWWTVEEIETVASDVARRLDKQGIRHVPQVGDRTGRGMLFEMMSAAQLLLERPRRRLRAQINQFKPEFFAAIENALTTRSFAQPEPTPPKQTEPGESASPSNAPAPAAQSIPPEPTPAPAPAADPLEAVPTAALLSAALSRMLGIVGNQEATARQLKTLEQYLMTLTDEVGQLRATIANQSNSHAVNGHAEKKQLPRVAVLGCRAYEMEHIRHGCEAAGIKLDFRHYDQDQNPRTVHADYAISLKWLNHGWDNTIKACIPASRYRFMNGGIGMAVAQLKAWFQN